LITNLILKYFTFSQASSLQVGRNFLIYLTEIAVVLSKKAMQKPVAILFKEIRRIPPKQRRFCNGPSIRTVHKKTCHFYPWSL